jgi:hypothetical protein
MAEKSSPWNSQTDAKNLVWFGEIERKLAKLLTVLPLNYFMVLTCLGCAHIWQCAVNMYNESSSGRVGSSEERFPHYQTVMGCISAAT